MFLPRCARPFLRHWAERGSLPLNVVWDIPVHIAMAGEVGVVPLLQHAAAMGIARAAHQLQRMGV